MKNFFSKYSYAMVRMFVNQCAISLFGAVLALFATSVGSSALTIGVSIGAIVFYLFLLYTVAWDVGSKDSAAIQAGRQKFNPMTGFLISLCANIPNFVLAILHAACLPFANSNRILSGICAIARVIALFIEGMYTGLMAVIHFGGSAMNTYSWAYFLLPLPAILMSGIAYIIGRYELHLTKLMLPLTPEEIEKKQEKKANRRSSSEK